MCQITQTAHGSRDEDALTVGSIRAPLLVVCFQPSVNDQVRPAWLVPRHFKEGEESESQRNRDIGDFKGRWDWTDWKYAHAETGISRLCVQKERFSKMPRRECQAHCPGCNLSCLVMSTWNVSKFTSDHTIQGKCRICRVRTLGNAGPLLANSFVLLFHEESRQGSQSYIKSALLLGKWIPANH